MTDTPNMGLTLPVVSTTLGPTWATMLNTALEEIDLHDHTTDKGVRVPTSGLNINADLAFGAYAALDIGRMELTDLGSALASGTTSVFVYDGELYYRDANGTNVQITDDGQVDNAAAGSILGLASPASAVFSALTSQFGWFYDSGKQAAMQMGDLQIFPFAPPTTYTNFITLKAPVALASNPTYTLPTAAPANANIVAMASDGTMSLGPADGSAANPSIAFNSDLDTGLYSAGANTVGVAAAGSAVANFSAAGIRNIAGSVGTPSYSFTGDTDTGLYNSASNVLDLVTAGNRSLILTAANAQFSGVLLQPAGSAAAPSYSFAGDTDTGIYNNSSDNLIKFAAAGTLGLTVGAAQSTFAGVVYTAAGSLAGPGHSFSGDTNTGMYSYGADQIGFSAGGLISLYVDANVVQVTSLRLLGDTDTGLSSTGADNIGIITGGSNRLNVSSASITPSVPIRAADGGAAAPSYSFNSDDNSGFYYAGSGAWGYSANGGATFVMDTSGTRSNYYGGLTDTDAGLTLAANYALLKNGTGQSQLILNDGSTILYDGSVGNVLRVSGGDIFLGNLGGSDLGFECAVTGGAGAVLGYMAVFINGVARRIPYHAV